MINRKRTFCVLGDMNFDISANKRTLATSIYIDHLTSCGSVPIITKPTRVTDKISTTIDHIITNDAAHVIQPGVIRCDKKLSDHYVIFCSVLGYNSAPPQETVVLCTRSAASYYYHKRITSLETNLNSMQKYTVMD